jgi:hypothetical protein
VLAAAPEALIAELIATFQQRILRLSLNASNFGSSKVSQRRLVSSPICSTVTTWTVSPEQVLLDGCADFRDERDHRAIAEAAERVLRKGYESTSDVDD